MKHVLHHLVFEIIKSSAIQPPFGLLTIKAQTKGYIFPSKISERERKREELKAG